MLFKVNVQKKHILNEKCTKNFILFFMSQKEKICSVIFSELKINEQKQEASQ